MKFGFFDDVHKEYVITTPETPLPWINYLGNEGFFSQLSWRGTKAVSRAEIPFLEEVKRL